MSAADPARKLKLLLKKLAAAHGEVAPPPPAAFSDCEPLTALLLQSFLIWEASPAQAAAAMKRIVHDVVDCNELRVCVPEELIRLLGPRYPRAAERAERLLASLHQVYEREHEISLASLASMPKRDALQYLATLHGMSPFIASRVGLIGLGAHTVPVDERLAEYLVARGIVLEDPAPVAMSGWLERQLRAGEALGAYLLLETAAEASPRPAKRPRTRSTSAKATTRPRTRKPTTRKE